jgi:hypothetical protein
MSLCPNCGKKSRYSEDKADSECENCGYKQIPTTKLDVANVVYCDLCGCNYLIMCAIHEKKYQHSIVPKVVEET